MTNDLINCWACTAAAVIILTARIVGRGITHQAIDFGDFLSIMTAICLLSSAAMIHVAIIWGTNNIPPQLRPLILPSLTPLDIKHRVLGSKLILAARVMYICSLWLLKSILLAFYFHIIQSLSYGRMVIVAGTVVLAVTFVVSIIVTFTDCDPFSHYYIVVPDPGPCTRALNQLYIVGVLNMFTDAMLIAFPIPVLVKARLRSIQRFTLAILFSIGILVIAFSAVRVVETALNTAQSRRIVWGSAEILAATFVANSPAMYALWKSWQSRRSR